MNQKTISPDTVLGMVIAGTAITSANAVLAYSDGRHGQAALFAALTTTQIILAFRAVANLVIDRPDRATDRQCDPDCLNASRTEAPTHPTEQITAPRPL